MPFKCFCIFSRLRQNILGLRSFCPFGSEAKTLVPGAGVWPEIDSTVESLPVLRIHRDCASHFESGLSESNYRRMSKLSRRFTDKIDSNCDSPDWNVKCTILYDPSDHLPPTGGARAQTHSAPAGPPIRRAGACSRWKSACSSSKRESICRLMREL